MLILLIVSHKQQHDIDGAMTKCDKNQFVMDMFITRSCFVRCSLFCSKIVGRVVYQVFLHSDTALNVPTNLVSYLCASAKADCSLRERKFARYLVLLHVKYQWGNCDVESTAMCMLTALCSRETMQCDSCLINLSSCSCSNGVFLSIEEQ